jgi:hypothetical protein
MLIFILIPLGATTTAQYSPFTGIHWYFWPGNPDGDKDHVLDLEEFQ